MNNRSERSSGHLRVKLGKVVEATLQVAPNRLARRLFKTSLTNNTSPYINSQTENNICIVFCLTKGIISQTAVSSYELTYKPGLVWLIAPI